MKIKTSELTGPALNWAVARCEGFESFEFWHTGAVTTRQENGLKITPRYSTDWAQGGPIIEREKLCVGYRHQLDPVYVPLLDPATVCWARTTAGGYLNCGPTPLIAAMRCFVASKLGAEVEVPEELCASAT